MGQPAVGRRRFAVFTGSRLGGDSRFAAAAADIAGAIARRGDGIIYGGSRSGLMGVVADTALAAGGEVIGVIPRPPVSREVAHEGLSRLEVVENLSARKYRMVELADVVLVLPGGAGTLDEFFEVWTWQQLGQQHRPVVIYDVNGYWQPLLDLLDHMVTTGFVQAAFREALIVADSPAVLWDRLAAWQQPAPKWAECHLSDEL